MISAPKWFKPLAVIALLWNLMGCAAFVSDLMLTAADVAKLDAAQQALYAARPAWSVGATGLAVIAGALGCVGLIMGKRWSSPLLILSLVAVVIQDISMFVMASGAAKIDSTAIILQGIVLAIAIGLMLLARKADKSGWLS